MRKALFHLVLCILSLGLTVAHAQTPQMMFQNPPSTWWRQGSSLSMDFINGRYMVSTTAPATYTSLTTFLTAVGGSFGRASTATYFDSTGTLQTAAINQPRFDYNPTTLKPQGILIETARTNLISNSTMAGAAVDTLPTSSWGAHNFNTLTSGTTYTITGTGSEYGMNYIDVRSYGTWNGDGQGLQQFYTGNIGSSPGISYTFSTYARLISGTLNQNALKLAINYNNGSTYLSESVRTITSGLSTTLQRFAVSGTTPASATSIQSYYKIGLTSGSTFDATIRLYAPQVEKGETPTSYIPTTTAPATRVTESLIFSTSGWYNTSGGTMYASALIPYSGATFWNSAFNIDNGSSSNTCNLYHTQSSRVWRMERYTDGAAGTSVNPQTYTTGQRASIAGTCVSGDLQAATSGTLHTANTGAINTSGFTTARLGMGRGTTASSTIGSSFLNGYLRKISFWPYRVPNAYLQELTASNSD